LGDFNVPMALEDAITLVKERSLRHGLTLDLKVDEKVVDL